MTIKQIKAVISQVEWRKEYISNCRRDLQHKVQLYNHDLEILKDVKEVYLSVCNLSWNKKDAGIFWEPIHVLYQKCKRNVKNDSEQIKLVKRFIKKEQRNISILYLLLR